MRGVHYICEAHALFYIPNKCILYISLKSIFPGLTFSSSKLGICSMAINSSSETS